MTHKPIGADDVTGELPAVVEARIATTIGAAVDVEETARIAGDAANAGAIAAETSRATTAEGTLQDNIDAEATTRATDDATETAARIAGDAALSTRLDQIGSKAYNLRENGAFTYLTTTAQDVPGCVVVVPATDADVWLEWQIQLALITPGQGATVALVYETTGGVAVQRGAPSRAHHNTGDAPTVSGDTLKGSVRIGPTTETRIFALYGNNVQEGSSLQTAFVNSTYGPTMFRAVAS